MINNNITSVQLAKSLLGHLTVTNLLSPSRFIQFQSQRLHQCIAGLRTSSFPLYQLGCLLNETWLEEDVVNALSEILYFRTAASSSAPGSNPPFVLLPTLFFNNAQIIIESGNLTYPPNILALRERLHAVPVTNISLISCNGGHFTGQIFADRCLNDADSMGNSAPNNILPIFRWLLDGLNDYEKPSGVHEKRVPLQVNAIGSCGIAALNFVETHVDPSTSSWTDATSTLHRNTALRNLIMYHLISIDVQGVGFSFFL